MLQIKVLLIEGLYKALVLDMTKRGNRIACVFEHVNEMDAYNMASDYVSKNDTSEDSELWH